MANQRSWWTLVISQEPGGPHDNTIELSDADKEHIASLIIDDFTEGEIVQDPPGDHELVWTNAGTDEPRDQTADSVHRIDAEATSAYYTLGPGLFLDGGRRLWDVELVQLKDGEVHDVTSLGEQFPDEQAAKECAQTWERYGRHHPS